LLLVNYLYIAWAIPLTDVHSWKGEGKEKTHLLVLWVHWPRVYGTKLPSPPFLPPTQEDGEQKGQLASLSSNQGKEKKKEEEEEEEEDKKKNKQNLVL
jgi:hypothetical protein